MAETQVTNWQNYLYELQGAVQDNFPKKHVILAELHGVGDPEAIGRRTRAKNPDAFIRGKYVRVPQVLNELMGAHGIAEDGTVNRPHSPETAEAHVQLARIIIPVGLSIDVERDSVGDTSAREAVAELTRLARIGIASAENDMIALTDGTGLLAAVTGGSSPGLTITVGTGANFDRLHPGRVVDVKTRSNGANPGNGLRRKIASVSKANGTVTFDTNAVDSYAQSGNITFSSNEGIYIEGSYGQSLQSLEQAAAATGTFESINKANVKQWQGIDGREGVTTEVPLSDTILDNAVLLGYQANIDTWDFGVGDGAVINLYKQGKSSQVNYVPDTLTLKSGFRGIEYQGGSAPFPLIKEHAHKKKAMKLIDKASFRMYGDSVGPEFVDDTGSPFMRFARTLLREMWLLDRCQMGVLRCQTLVYLNDLKQAA